MSQLDNIKSDKGVTLYELLAVIAISGIVLTTIIGVFNTGLVLYKKIGIESQIRDEADIILSNVLNELYKTSPNEIIYKENELTLLSYENINVNEKDFLWRNTIENSLYKKTISVETLPTPEQFTINIKTTLPDYTIEEINLSNNNYILTKVKDNLGNSLPIISFECLTYERGSCTGGEITTQFLLGHKQYSQIDSRLYVEPLEFYSKFGY